MSDDQHEFGDFEPDDAYVEGDEVAPPISPELQRRIEEVSAMADGPEKTTRLYELQDELGGN